MTQTRRHYSPRATDARFVRAADGDRGRMHIQVNGEHFVERAMPLLARLGDQPVTAIVIRDDGEGFSGILERAPRDGDRLFVGYAGGPLGETDVVYRAHAEPAALV